MTTGRIIDIANLRAEVAQLARPYTPLMTIEFHPEGKTNKKHAVSTVRIPWATAPVIKNGRSQLSIAGLAVTIPIRGKMHIIVDQKVVAVTKYGIKAEGAWSQIGDLSDTFIAQLQLGTREADTVAITRCIINVGSPAGPVREHVLMIDTNDITDILHI